LCPCALAWDCKWSPGQQKWMQCRQTCRRDEDAEHEVHESAVAADLLAAVVRGETMWRCRRE
jgi:hypothetical protein